MMYVTPMVTSRAATAAERMQQLREGGRRVAAHNVAEAATGFEFGREALPGLEDDLFSSRLSLSDLEELLSILLDHARQPVPDNVPEEYMTISTSRFPRQNGRPTRRGSLWKFNVSPANLSACVDHSLFADDQQRSLARGDLLVLQQTKSKAVDMHRRITHVFEFDHYTSDHGGRSQELWGKHFEYLLHGRMHRLATPFSLEDLSLSKSYSQQGKIAHERIASEDQEAVIEAIGVLA